MTALRVIAARLLALFTRKRLERELDEELQFHLDMEIEDRQRSGLAPDEARRLARLRTGGRDQTREAWRDAHGFTAVEALVSDVRHGARLLAKYPFTTITVVASLAIGIGVNTAIMSIVNGMFWRPPALYRDGDSLVLAALTAPGAPGIRRPVSAAVYRGWLAADDLVEGFAAAEAPLPSQLVVDSAPEPVTVQAIDAKVIPLLGVAPSRGRTFRADEERPGAEGVALISHRLWQQRFEGASDIVGRSVGIGQRSHTIVGVLPERFAFFAGSSPDIWVPLTIPPDDGDPAQRRLWIVARKRTGVEAAQLQAVLSDILRRLDPRFPAQERGWGVRVVPLVGVPLIEARVPPGMWVIGAAIWLALLIACTNIAILMVARWTARQQETAVRAALGASRIRLVRLLFIEALLMCILGGATGLILAYVVREALLSYVRLVHSPLDFTFDSRVLLFTSTATMITALVAGLAPALLETSVRLTESLKGATPSGVSPPRQRMRRLLVVGEVAMTTILLAGALSLIQRYARGREPVGFDPSGLLVLRIETREAGAPQGAPSLTERYADRDRFERQILDRIKAMPEVEAATITLSPPLSDGSQLRSFFRARPVQGIASAPIQTGFGAVSSGFFGTLGVDLREGRDFEAADAAAAPPVAIVNDALARSLWPGRSALGELLWEEPALGSRPRRIVGVVANHTNRGQFVPPWPAVYVPRAQEAPPETAAEQRPLQAAMAARSELVVRPRGSSTAAAVIQAIRQEVVRVDPNRIVGRVISVTELLEIGAAEFLAAVYVIGPIGAFALLLSAIGIFGVLSFTVSRRRREIGLRIALGAAPNAVARTVAGGGLGFAAVGLIIGVGIYLPLASWTGMAALEPSVTVVAGAIALVTAAAIAGSLAPARRASRCDPMTALRTE